jgi:chemotaxis protein CheD
VAGSPTIAHLFTQRLVVGVGELAVSNASAVTISTYALGSCVGLVAYDPALRVGGILHLMLPESTLSPEKAAAKPAMFADTGVPALFRALAGLRAERARTRLFLAGGACVLSGPDTFRIGERNAEATQRMLSVYGCSVVGRELGGTVNRTLHLNVSSGELTIKLPDHTLRCSLA